MNMIGLTLFLVFFGRVVYASLPGLTVLSALSATAVIVGGGKFVQQPVVGAWIAGAGLVGAALVLALTYRPDATGGSDILAFGGIGLSLVGLVLLVWHVRRLRVPQADSD